MARLEERERRVTKKMVVSYGTVPMVVFSLLLLLLLLSFPRQAVQQECLYVTSGSTEMAVLRPPSTEPLISFPAGTETTGTPHPPFTPFSLLFFRTTGKCATGT